MVKKYLNQRQINKLRRELVAKTRKNKKKKNIRNNFYKSHNSNNSNYSNISPNSQKLSSEYYKMNNKAIGINFETNIRESLQSDYGWKNVGFKEAFFYTEIKINGQTEIITSVNKKAINVNNNIAIFQINKNKSLEIIEDEKVIKNKNNELPKNITVFDQEIEINTVREAEIDGLFKDYNLNKFDKEEII